MWNLSILEGKFIHALYSVCLSILRIYCHANAHMHDTDTRIGFGQECKYLCIMYIVWIFSFTHKHLYFHVFVRPKFWCLAICVLRFSSRTPTFVLIYYRWNKTNMWNSFLHPEFQMPIYLSLHVLLFLHHYVHSCTKRMQLLLCSWTKGKRKGNESCHFILGP